MYIVTRTGALNVDVDSSQLASFFYNNNKEGTE